ncbi:MAG: hypothetical protein WC516_02410 [Patescibacteria group bacterium]
MKTLNPNDFGKPQLVEECQKIRIDDFLKTCRVELKRQTLNLEIEARGLKIELTTSKTSFDGQRFWFACPICKKRVGVLYEHPILGKIGCRECLRLDYTKRRYKGMVEVRALNK